MTDETPEAGEITEQVLASLDPDVAEVVRGYLEDPIASIDLLEDRVALYAKELESRAEEGGVFDLDQALTLTRQCEALLSVAEELAEEPRRLVQAATLYLCVADDADGDMESLIGFDDDAALIEAVAVAIGRADLLDE